MISILPVLLPLLIAPSCVAPPRAPQGSVAPVTLHADDFRPIRFGDDETHSYEREFFPDAVYRDDISTPDKILGQQVGSRLARHSEILSCFDTWATESKRLDLATYGTTYEGRRLVRAVISSEANIKRLDEIRVGLAKLSDPRGLDKAEAEHLLSTLPAVAWAGYSVHGDELSGADAALAVGYHLLASEDPDVHALLEDVLVVIDPAMNPDGRDRIVSRIEQTFGYVANLDYASMHRGSWPGGRGNHYLFDMNRDWMSGIAPETRGRWRAVREFPPQLFIDAHEMSGLDTYLFYPQSRPHNTNLPEGLFDWQSTFADSNARAFDEEGWGYYSREWADAFYPAYSDSWGSLNGAIGMLYEQGSTDGQPLRRASGEVVSYRESVHGHVKSTMANLATLLENKDTLLRRFLEARRSNISTDQPDANRVFAILPTGNITRTTDLVERLLAQGIEIERTLEEMDATEVVTSMGRQLERQVLPVGTLLIRVRQPQAPLVRAFLSFDPRMSHEMLVEERRSLETGEGSKMYDMTAWSLGRAWDLDCLWFDESKVSTSPVLLGENNLPVSGALSDSFGSRAVAWAIDGSDDSAIRFAASALESGLVLHVSDKPFTATGRTFPAGSFILRRHENEAPEFAHLKLEDRIAKAASASLGVVFKLTTLRSPDEGPDLGGGHFTQLTRPKVALVTGSGVSSSDFGHIWRLVDEELRMPFSLVEASSLGRYDLRRFNVLILPPGAGGAAVENEGALREWVAAGGTLIAMGSSAARLTGTELTDVKLRRTVLDSLNEYEWSLQRERGARTIEVDEAALFDVQRTPDEDAKDSEQTKVVSFLDDAPDAETSDQWMRRFSPSGVLLRGEVDTTHWLASGARSNEMPIYFSGSSVYLSKTGAVVRMAPAEDLRLGGLLWPEARERVADSAWAVVEGLGSGQVILFATPPSFRGFFKGTARMLANAIVLGPGAGADQTIDL